MTIAALAVAGLMAAAGTRLAVLALVAAAGIGAASGGSMAPVATWTAALAAGLLALGASPRRLALPVLGASAVLAAGSATNAAVVLMVWVVGSLAAVLSREGGQAGDRWALGLALSDVPVVAAIAYTAQQGFVGWPDSLSAQAAIALAMAALVKVPLIGGEPGPGYAGLLIVRAQVIVLAIAGLGVAPGDVRTAAAAIGAGVFAAGALPASTAVRDGAQEAGLVFLAISTTTLGFSPLGWSWGVLAGGTLIHCLRVRGVRDDPFAPLARLVAGGGGVWLPILPAAAALAAAVVTNGGWLAAAVLVGLGAGLAGRIRDRGRPEPSRPSLRRSPLERARSASVVVLAAVPALWAGLLSLPRPPGAEPVAWPPIWAGALVLAAACGGVLVPGLAPAREPRAAERAPSRAGTLLVRFDLVRVLSGHPRVLSVLLVLLVSVAVVVWVLGWLRGFL